MFSKVSIFAVLAVGAYLSLSNHGAEALTCYNCNATAACNSPFNTTTVGNITCAVNEQCAVLKYNLPTAQTYTFRGCITNRNCTELNGTLSNPDQTLASCTVCSTDLCNSATVFAVPLVALVVSFLAVKYVQ